MFEERCALGYRQHLQRYFGAFLSLAFNFLRLKSVMCRVLGVTKESLIEKTYPTDPHPPPNLPLEGGGNY